MIADGLSVLTMPSNHGDDDRYVAETTLELIGLLQQRRSLCGLKDATLHAHALHGAALAFLQCEVGVDGVRKMLDAAVVENDRQRARDAIHKRDAL